jgi:hypothetical protein
MPSPLRVLVLVAASAVLAGASASAAAPGGGAAFRTLAEWEAAAFSSAIPC